MAQKKGHGRLWSPYHRRNYFKCAWSDSSFNVEENDTKIINKTLIITVPCLSGQSNLEAFVPLTFENATVFENDIITSKKHRINTAQPTFLILLSFSSALLYVIQSGQYKRISAVIIGFQNRPYSIFWVTQYNYSQSFLIKLLWNNTEPLLVWLGRLMGMALRHFISTVHSNE